MRNLEEAHTIINAIAVLQFVYCTMELILSNLMFWCTLEHYHLLFIIKSLLAIQILQATIAVN